MNQNKIILFTFSQPKISGNTIYMASMKYDIYGIYEIKIM